MELVAELASEIRACCGLEETVIAEQDSFSLSVCGFLREMDCPYPDLLKPGSLSAPGNRTYLLEYLTSELQACRMNGSAPVESAGAAASAKSSGSSHPIMTPINRLLRILSLPPASANMSVFNVFTNIENRIRDRLPKLPPGHLSEPLLEKQLSADQWDKVAPQEYLGG